jgi:hypothetical protein
VPRAARPAPLLVVIGLDCTVHLAIGPLGDFIYSKCADAGDT